MGMSAEASKILHRDITGDDNYVSGFGRVTSSVLAPGSAVDKISKKAVEVINEAMDNLASEAGASKDGRVITELWSWTHREMLMATTDAVYGLGNPYKDSKIEKAWKSVQVLSFHMRSPPNLKGSLPGTWVCFLLWTCSDTWRIESLSNPT